MFFAADIALPDKKLFAENIGFWNQSIPVKWWQFARQNPRQKHPLQVQTISTHSFLSVLASFPQFPCQKWVKVNSFRLTFPSSD